MLEAKKSIQVIARALGKSRGCVSVKIARLGLEVVVGAKKTGDTTTSCLTLPLELPSVEYALKILAVAMETLKTSGLDKSEFLRLRNLIQAATAYQAKVAEFIDYRGIESRLAKIEENSPSYS